MQDIVFRKAAANDMGDILRLQTEVFHGEQKIPANEIPQFLERDPQCWVAVAGRTIVGAAAAWEEDGVMHWGRFVTKKEYRGLHIGTRLTEFSFRALFETQVSYLYMEARDITKAIVCKMGGRVVGKSVPFYEGTITPILLHKEDFYKVLP